MTAVDLDALAAVLARGGADNYDLALNLLRPVVDRIANERAAAELEAAADEMEGDGKGGLAAAFRHIFAPTALRGRAAALREPTP